ncbi:leucine-rich repeat protein [Muricauda sp. SCSIO 64092]|uniref:leucine-rich repeat protein n=1 Tax=Allomuricauda sp. SCSIO 64092 TaxID=2908842 RepID=UPI001FF67117|nr:leucine-rich repeat protein [Muricauda sp. SCSIO 64092]UOY08258.1 leucine-rich repeat protein [Muricauda sp. SCSIO 64092]
MKKQLQLIACTVCMVLMGLKSYGQTFTVEDITYQVIGPNTVAITGNTNTGDLIIPGNVTNGGDTFTVTSIGPGTFVANDLTKVTIPESITSIGANAFTDNPGLLEVVAKGANPPPSLDPSAFGDRSEIALIVPKGSITAYEGIFGWTGFKSITEEEIAGADDFEHEVIAGTNTVRITGYKGTATSVNIPETITKGGIQYKVTHIGAGAFKDNALTSVTLPNSLTHIEAEAFRDSGLSGHLEIPDGVESIGNDAFNSRKNGAYLDSVTLPNSVTRIGQRAFAGHLLKSVNIPDKLQVLEGGVFANNNLNQVTIPESVTEIQGSAFNRNALASVTIPSSVIKIGPTAFANNNNLTIVGVESSDPPTLDGTRVFEQKDDKHFGKITVIVPRGARNNYKNADSWNLHNIREELTVNDFFTYPHVSFAKDGMHYQVTQDLDTTQTPPLPRTVKLIGRSTIGPLDVVIPDRVFHGVPYTVTAIGDNAFLGNGLTSVEIPESVTSIGESAFEGNQLGEIIIPKDMEKIGTNAFKNSGLTGHLEIPNSVTDIGFGAFSLNELTGVTISNNLETLKIGVFYGNKLESVTIPENVAIIEKSVFGNNEKLSRVVMENAHPPELANEAFIIVHFPEDDLPDGDHRHNVDVIVPRGTNPGENKYRYLHPGNDWGGFKSITEVGEIGEEFTVNGITYQVAEFNPNTVIITDNTTTGDLTIPESVTKPIEPNEGLDFRVAGIGAGAFQNSQLTRVIIPEGVTRIGANAFSGNPNLTKVELKRADPTMIEESTFANRDQIDVIVGAGGFDNYVPAWDDFKFKSIKAKVAIGETFTVERDANTAVIKYEVTAFGPTNTVTVINNEDDDRILLEIFDPVEYVGHGFKVTKIGGDAFIGRNLTGALTIPDGVESIGDFAFADNRLEDIAIPESVTRIGASAFADNQLTGVTVPENVTDIGNGAFRYNELTSVAIGRNVTDIGDGAFQGNLLTSVIIPENVTGIGANAFTDNPDLATVVSMPFVPPSIEENTFTNADRGQIDLIVPMGVPAGRIRANYEDAGWTGFRSIREGIGVSIDAPTEPVDLSAFTVTIRFDLDVTGFTIDDIDLGNAVANHFTGSGSLYTVEITPTSCNSAVTIDLPANAVDMPNSTNLPASARVAVEADPNSFVVIARDIAVQLNANGRATISPDDVDNGSYSCDGSTFELGLDIDTLSCDDVGTPVMVTLTAALGDRTATATAMVTVFGNCGPGSDSSLADFNRGFSPNGDGIGDTLVIHGLERYGNNVVRIYDLSQRLLFSAHYGGPGDAWDGTDERGLVPVGNYVCVIDYNESGLGHEAKMIYINY